MIATVRIETDLPGTCPVGELKVGDWFLNSVGCLGVVTRPGTETIGVRCFFPRGGSGLVGDPYEILSHPTTQITPLREDLGDTISIIVTRGVGKG
jgi:hypothetical protein